MLALMDLDDMLPELGTYRPLKRVEYDRLVAEGYFDDEKVELLFGMVVPMVPIDPAHDTSQYAPSESSRSRLELAHRCV